MLPLKKVGILLIIVGQYLLLGEAQLILIYMKLFLNFSSVAIKRCPRENVPDKIGYNHLYANGFTYFV